MLYLNPKGHKLLIDIKLDVGHFNQFLLTLTKPKFPMCLTGNLGSDKIVYFY